jgi:hypothetical protein
MTTLLCPIHEDLKKDPLTIGIQGQLRSHHQVHDFSNDHVKFKFQDGLFYRDGILHVFYATCDFKFSRLNTMLWLQAILDSTQPWN